MISQNKSLLTIERIKGAMLMLPIGLKYPILSSSMLIFPNHASLLPNNFLEIGFQL